MKIFLFYQKYGIYYNNNFTVTGLLAKTSNDGIGHLKFCLKRLTLS